MTTYAHITANCFINAPFSWLQGEVLEKFIQNRFQPEIGLEGEALYTCSRGEFERVAQALRQAGLGCTIHAPFFDLAPGGLDRYIRRASREKLKKAFELIPLFQPAAIICHLNYEENKQGYKQAEWFNHALETWRQLLRMTAGSKTTLVLENTYEQNPAQHRAILSALASPQAGFCLDVGHTLAFAKNSWRDWLPAMDPWLRHLHLHDNHGGQDLHLGIGQGKFDFAGLFAYLGEHQLTPRITLEPHSEEGIWQSLAALDQFGLFPRTEPA